MLTCSRTVDHIDVVTPHDYEHATALFLERVPRNLAPPPRSRADVDAMMRAAGELGILVMASLDQGHVVSLIGPPRKLAVYLIGSPFLGARLFEEHPAAGLYAPAHVTIYEDEYRFAHFAYDKPSTLLAAVGVDGRAFDEKLAAIAQALSSQCS